MYTADSIDRIREVDIATIIGRYTTLNSHLKGCCPIHNEKSPSLSIKRSTNTFKCFGCGAGGDAIKFIIETEKCTFIEAIEKIAAISGITLDQEQTKYSPEQTAAYQAKQQAKKTQIQLLMEAKDLYRQQLTLSPAIMQYLTQQRNMDQQSILQWGIGYAPTGGRYLCDKYSNAGLLPIAAAACLVREKDARHYDIYQGRIIFPIHNHKGELVSFGGRATNDTDAKAYGKYINGYATDLYNKSATLYGLDKAAKSIATLGYAIRVEGYTDVISMHRAGATNTIAACGTAFTTEQATLLARYTNQVVIMTDGDDAGQAATTKDLKILLAKGFRVEVITLAQDQDPDTFAQQYFPSPAAVAEPTQAQLQEA